LLMLVFGMALSMVIKAQVRNWLPANTTVAVNGTFETARTADMKACSPDGRYQCSYRVGAVGDEYREITNFKMFDAGSLIYTMDRLPGSDVMLSNSGRLAVFDLRQHFEQRVGMIFYDRAGTESGSMECSSATQFGFSPSGEVFSLALSGMLTLIDLQDNGRTTLGHAFSYGLSGDASLAALATYDGLLRLYENGKLMREVRTGMEYIRKVAVSGSHRLAAVADANNLIVFTMDGGEELFHARLGQGYKYRDLLFAEGALLAGVHEKMEGHSAGFLHVYDLSGQLLMREEISAKEFRTFEPEGSREKLSTGYDPIPWPFVPFNEVHTVWNHYEQHMGDGSSNWSYLHQGLDIIVPVAEPIYAVEEGFVKCVLTIGGEYYWRLAVSPVQSPGYSDGWLYAHLIQSTIQVAPGDTVEQYDYLGDIIDWFTDWGHTHFVQIRDTGTVWQYEDNEWGINFNPLLAITPNIDPVAPQIENALTNARFAFCLNETSTYLNANNLHGSIDIIVKISDYHANSPWEQPAYMTFYEVKKLPGNTTVFPKRLGQILNHTYSFYESGHYEVYAPLMYKLDYQFPSPPWSYEDRDYYQILTNNNGDSVAELAEKNLAFKTTDYFDGNYRIVVEAWDETGNFDIDSMDVVFNNGITGEEEIGAGESIARIYPNPSSGLIFIEPSPHGSGPCINKLTLLDRDCRKVMEVTCEGRPENAQTWTLDVSEIPAGVYFLVIDTPQRSEVRKIAVVD